MLPPHATLLPTHPSISIFFISGPILGHPITLVPHRHHTITLSFHPTFRIPVLDHPNSKLWAGGQGRQAQRRRGIRHHTTPVIEPQTAVGDLSRNPPPGRHPSRRGARRLRDTRRSLRAPEEGARFSVGWGGVAADRSEGHRAFLDD